MSDPVRSLDRLKVDSPCTADWDSMVGNDQVRFCEHCNLHVNDLSTMTRPEAMRLVRRSKGRFCVRFIQRPDGGVLTRGLPDTLYRISRRASRIAAGAFTAALSLSSAAAQTRSDSSPTALREPTTSTQVIPAPELGASLSGTVTDPNGAVIAGATLTLSNSESHVAFTYTTGDDGAYRFSFLEAGVYSLVMEAPSFARTERPGVDLKSSANKALNVVAELPAVVAEVEVSAGKTEVVFTGGAMAMATPAEPLVKAAFANEPATIKELLLSAADVNVRDEATKMTALDYAVENGNGEIVRMLLLAGADARAVGEPGHNALMYLGVCATGELVRVLVSAGASINAQDDSGATALMKAVSSCNVDVVRELIADGAGIDARDEDGTTVLMNAAENDDANVVALLLKAGVDVSAKDGAGQTALMIAVKWGKPAAAKALIEARAEINVADKNGKSTLMLAAANDEPEFTKLLIAAGAKVNAKDDEGATALMIAAEQGNVVIVKALIAAGGEVNAKDEDGQTSLMRAADSDQLDCVRVLLAADADFTVRNKDGKTALGLARDRENEEVVQLLISRGAPE